MQNIQKGIYYTLKDCTITKDGAVFYYSQGLKPFSLPKGGYVCNCKLLPYLQNFDIDYSNIIFYEPEKRVKFKGIRQLILKKNPFKCSIDIRKGYLIFDTDFYNSLNNPQKFFVFSHEMGHYFYKSEKKADTFATAMMLLAGYNKSQISACVNSTLVTNYRKLHNKKLLTKK